MKGNFKIAVEKDERDNTLPVMPISEIDAKIISEIMVALERSGSELLLEILKQYKIMDDEAVLNLVQDYNIDEIDEEEEDFLPKFVNIG